MKSSEINDDPALIQSWLEDQRENVKKYLSDESINFTNIPEIKWFLAPYISIWNIKPNIWIISGDLPTDYIQNENIKKVSDAVKSFADQWLEISECLLNGEQHPQFPIGESQETEQLKKMGSLLQNRANLFHKWIDEKVFENN